MACNREFSRHGYVDLVRSNKGSNVGILSGIGTSGASIPHRNGIRNGSRSQPTTLAAIHFSCGFGPNIFRGQVRLTLQLKTPTDELDFYTEDEPPPVDREKLRRQVQQLRYQRQEELRNEGRDATPSELADLQDALRELASAGAMDVIRLVELHEAVDRLRTLFQAVLRAYRAAYDGELRWMLMHEEHPWFDLVESARTAIQGNIEAQRWCELGFWVGKCLACTSFPRPRDLIPADLQEMNKVATALAPGSSTPWRKKLAAFLKAAKAVKHDNWLNQLLRAASALVAADVAIRAELEAATGQGPWVIIDHTKRQIVLFGQVLPFDIFSTPGLKLFLVLANRPSEKVDAAELVKMSGLKVARSPVVHNARSACHSEADR